jgi:hypothetical protein
MINFSKLNLTEGMDPIEQSASDSATQSAEKKRDPSRIQRQKIQMAQSPGNKVKSNTVYASESVNKVKSYNRQKSDWRSEIKEAKDEIEHPYVDVMPMTNGSEKRAKEEMKLAKKMGVSNANQVIGEEIDFDEVFGKLVDEEFIPEMRKQDKVAGVKPGGTDDMALRMVKRQLKQMHGGQQKKKVKGAKPLFPPQTPVDKIKNRLSQKRAPKPDPYRPRAGESD